jgi:Sec-independent protein translocase protein TatA
MFGIGFGEILVVLFLAAVLIRPADMPAVGRAAARLWMRARRFFADIDGRIGDYADEFPDMKKSVRELPESLSEQVRQIKKAMRRDPGLYDEIEDKKTPRLDIGSKGGRK